MNDYNDIWTNLMNILKESLAPVTLSSYFKECSIYKIENEVENNKPLIVITIETPTTYIQTRLEKSYMEYLEEAFINIFGKNCKIKFILTEEIEKIKSASLPKLSDKQESLNNEANSLENHTFDDNLIEKYTFDNFIIGESNRLAHTAALSVAEQPGKVYNPFFLHGKSGLGKTHLMHAIGNYLKKYSNKKVLYVTSETFISDFTSINMKKESNYAQQFKDKYRSIDVLMIDDIQFLGGAEKTQQEFFHTFNNLYDSNKQIIISSDRSPDDLKFLEERLRTRFSWGLTVNIYPPDLELKKRLVKNKMNEHEASYLITDEVIDFIASNTENDVRHIEGTITRLFAYSALMNPQKIDLEFANEALKDYIKSSVYNDSNITKIQKAVADYYNLTVEDLKSKKRSNNINYPRQIAIYLCRNYTEESFPKIGIEFGNRDHSTIMHACDKIQKDIKDNSKLKEIIDEIKDKIT